MIYIQKGLMRGNREKTATMFIRKVLLLLSNEAELAQYNYEGRVRKGSKPKIGFKSSFPLLSEELKGYYIPVNFKLKRKAELPLNRKLLS